MANKYKKIYFFALCVFVLNMFSACSSSGFTDSNDSISRVDGDSSSKKNTKNSLEKPTEAKKLSINYRCTGCNRCAMIDREHFSRSFGHQAPSVISQKNLSSVKLQNAIRSCPVDAIVLES